MDNMGELHGEGPYRDAEAELEEVRGVHELSAGKKNWFSVPGGHADQAPALLPIERTKKRQMFVPRCAWR